MVVHEIDSSWVRSWAWSSKRLLEQFLDIKGSSEAVNQRNTDNTIVKRKGQKDKQRSTKHYTENYSSRNTNSTKNGG